MGVGCDMCVWVRCDMCACIGNAWNAMSGAMGVGCEIYMCACMGEIWQWDVICMSDMWNVTHT